MRETVDFFNLKNADHKMRFNKKPCNSGTLHGGLLALLLAGVIIIGIFAIPNSVRHTRSPSLACISNLRQIDGAKQTWALKNKADSNATPTWDNIQPYLGCGKAEPLPKCPQGGIYTLGNLQTAPKCSIKGHALD
jgi:hypothetical protein